MRTLLANVLFTFRLIRRSPAFYALILALLTAGIAATTAMFSVAESVILKPLPYAHAEDLTDIFRVDPQFPRTGASAADFLDLRAQGTSFEQMAAVNPQTLSLSFEGAIPVSIAGAAVTADFFPMLRLTPLLGRLLGPDDDRPGAPLAVVISVALWKSQFGSDPGVVGRKISLNSLPYTVVGVAPPGFAFGSRNNGRVAAWTSLFAPRTPEQYAKEVAEQRGSHYLGVMGRKRHGVSIAEAQAQLTGIARSLETAFPDTNAKQGVYVADLHDSLVGRQGRQVWILFAAIALVFLVVSANVASLLLARAQGRRGELATRAALGAAPSALVLQVITETAVLFGIGALFGSALATSLVERLARYLVGGWPVGAAIVVRTDLAVLAGSVAASVLVGLAAGVGPALSTARTDPASVLKQTSTHAGVHKSHATVRAALVVTQLALAFALLTGSALTVRAFVRLLGTSPGFDKSDAATTFVALPSRKYDDDTKIRVFFRDALAAIANLPGVESVAGNSFLPMMGSDSSGNFSIEGRPPWPPGESPALDRNEVTPGYFATLKIPLLRGRAFMPEDNETSRPVIILSETAANRFFPGEDPIGRRMNWGSPSDGDTSFTWREVVGVVGDVRKDSLGEAPRTEAYTPFAQDPSRYLFIVARTRTTGAVLSALPRVIQSVDPEIAASGLQTLEEAVAGTIDDAHRLAVLLSLFALTALVLATLGLFGLVSYATTERTRELGIRIALGSTPEAVVGLVVKGAMKLVAAGLALGLVLSVWVAREVATVVPGASTFEPGIVAPIPLVLAAAGLLACLLPALRAVRTPPASALRYE